MFFKQGTVSLLCLILTLIGLPNGGAPEPAQCVHWRVVFPNCNCISAVDENGQELASVAVVDCSSKDLSSVPQKQADFSRTLYEFRLSDNKISTLPSNAFQGIKIRHLDLSGNSMGEIDDNAFNGTESELVILTIEGNSMGQPQKNALSKLRNLEVLRMKNYNVSELGDSTDQSYFLPFSNIRELTLDNWGITYIGADAFLVGGRSDDTHSHTLRILRLLNQKFDVLPVDALHEPELQNLETLQISYTQTKEISHSAFSGLRRVKEIILSYNKINTISDNSFKSVGITLEKIDLSNNFLGASGQEDLPHLANLPNLKQLILHSNEFPTIPKLEKLGSTQPLSVDLSKNKISRLSANDLANYRHLLKGLDLSENNIAEIEDQAFTDATSLQSLIVSNQGGDSTTALRVPSSLKSSSSSLTYLDFSGRKLEPVQLWNVLKQLKSLKTLILHSVQLNGIPDYAFRNLPDLTELNLSYNNDITQITDRTFVGPRRLEKLALRYTSIKALPSCLFFKNMNPISLDLASISIACDCSIKKLLEEYQQGLISFPTADSIPTCSDDGSKVISRDLDELSCTPQECTDYYITTPPPEPQTTDDSEQPTPTIQIRVLSVGQTYIKIAWNLTDVTGLQKHSVKMTVSSSQTSKNFDNLSTEQELNIPNLASNTHYNVCVVAKFTTGVIVSECEALRTEAKLTPSPFTPSPSDGDSTGIIVGCVVGVLALLAIMAAIAYLVIIRRRPKKPTGPVGMVQPRTFTKSELPSMNGDSRSFVKNKKIGTPDSKPVGGMQVVAISDGQTRPSGVRVGRAQMLSPDGTYEPMNKPTSKDVDYEPMKKPYEPMQGAVNSAYENDHRSLPPTPTKEQFDTSPSPTDHDYYNKAFSKETYEEISM